MTNRTFKAGASREQASLLPPRVEDYVAADNPVRAIESYVAALDVGKLGFRHAKRGVGVGQPPYHPTDLLKLYLYGYLNGVRSSRRLEREAQRNLELIWLLKGLTPGYRTIATFRQENWAALPSCRERTRTPGYCRRTAGRWPASMSRSPSTTSTSSSSRARWSMMATIRASSIRWPRLRSRHSPPRRCRRSPTSAITIAHL